MEKYPRGLKESPKFKPAARRKKNRFSTSDRVLRRDRLKLIVKRRGGKSKPVVQEPANCETQKRVNMTTGAPLSLTVKESILAAREFQGSKLWVVDNSNCLAAILALAATQSEMQPNELYLIARDDTEEDLPIEAVEVISNMAKDCRISMRFVDSFLKPCGTITDRRRLEHIMAKTSFTCDRFYGYLDKATITRLPNTLISLGLAIKNRVDAATICQMTSESLGERFLNFNVSVSSDVDVKYLEPLHGSFFDKYVYLTFPYLTDEWIDNVRPAIDALTTERGVMGLYFLKSQLTASGFRRLAPKLSEAGVIVVGIETYETWNQDKKERDSIQEAFEYVVKKVMWDDDFLYKESTFKMEVLVT